MPPLRTIKGIGMNEEWFVSGAGMKGCRVMIFISHLARSALVLGILASAGAWPLHAAAGEDNKISAVTEQRADTKAATAAPTPETPAPAGQEPPARITESGVLIYLEQGMDWQRSVEALEEVPSSAREKLLHEALRRSAKRLVASGIEFARAQAAILGPQGETDDAPESEAAARRQRLLALTKETDQQVVTLQEQIKQLPRRRATAQTQVTREKLNGELRLAQAQQETLRTMTGIFTATEGASGTLLDKIENLARTAIVETPDSTVAVKSVVAASVPPPTEENEKRTLYQESDGMFRLSGALFSLGGKKSELAELIAHTKRLKQANRELITVLRGNLREALKEGRAITGQATPTDKKSLNDYRESLDALIARYKQYSTAIAPLGQVSVALDAGERNLQAWSGLIDEAWSKVLRLLLFRIAVLAVAIAIPLILSDLAHRATLRYVQDPRRQKQLHIVRRIILGFILTIVILLNFVSEFGSLATYAGFLTAGLAVALQTVLVSAVGYFFFFGRYGVRAGDRVTVAGVTGDVVQVGMMRLYIRELRASEDGELAATGKIVAFPNSILFQPTAFYKHVGEE